MQLFIVMLSCQFGTKAVAYVELRMAGVIYVAALHDAGSSLVLAGLGSRSVFVESQ